MSDTIIVPGFGGSGDGHWQTIWRESDSSLASIRPESWDRPELEDWIDSLDVAVGCAGKPPILVAHSLGCLLVAHWAVRRSPAALPVAGAFLVAPPDPDHPGFPQTASSFWAPPRAPLPFPALVIASRNDPYASLDHVNRQARAWGAEVVSIGDAGHINALSSLGDWPFGAMLLTAFRAGTAGSDGRHGS